MAVATLAMPVHTVGGAARSYVGSSTMQNGSTWCSTLHRMLADPAQYLSALHLGVQLRRLTAGLLVI